jgi:hypothetical protein
MQTVHIQARVKAALAAELDKLVAASLSATNRSDYLRWLLEREVEKAQQQGMDRITVQQQ